MDCLDSSTNYVEEDLHLVANDEVWCLAKMYDCIDNSFKLNDMIEIIGIYTVDHSLVSTGPVATDEYLLDSTSFDDDVCYPPSSMAPRLHCLSYRYDSSSYY